MVKRMLIDAAHQEEMRVVVVDGTRLEEFDVETSTKKQLKGNIYLAKVIRVEPSLQAAFVDYGNERHGFLPFSEIHPDYYQIPVADREILKETLMQSQRESARKEEEEVEEELKSEETEDAESLADVEEVAEEPSPKKRRHRRGEMKEAAEIEVVREGEEVHPYRSYFDMLRKYKIQEVIRRNQILLVQVVKEERGNKGAALTTYLSLAGRYCVLMPNNARGGGVSRKISNIADRHKLKAIVNSLPVPDGMSVILRTAGRERTKLEIKRDYEYLIKTWVQIRDMTMASVAPCLIHEEGNLIRRSIRDIYTPDISEILIEGDGEFKAAKDFVKMIIPAHARKVKCYKGDIPLFHRYQVETQLEMLHNPIVQLKSGGYLVINPTEALVAIDVNSGRSTREHSIEDTALKTNLEAVDEVARQLRLRDLAGLIVIDLIDMEEPKNNITVERRMRDILRRDRARIQLARINGFGLMEISRQRLHSSFIETSYHVCPYCQGTGVQRSIESVSVHVLRLLEEEASTQVLSSITITVPSNVALYILNHKRDLLTSIEKNYDLSIVINGEDGFVSITDYRLEKVKRVIPVLREENIEDDAEEDVDVVEAEEAVDEEGEAESESETEAVSEEGVAQEKPEVAGKEPYGQGRRRVRGLYGRRRQRFSHRGERHGEEAADAEHLPTPEVAEHTPVASGDAAAVAEVPAVSLENAEKPQESALGDGVVADSADEKIEVEKPKKRGRPRKNAVKDDNTPDKKTTENNSKENIVAKEEKSVVDSEKTIAESGEIKKEKTADAEEKSSGKALVARKTTSVVQKPKGAVILFSSHNIGQKKDEEKAEDKEENMQEEKSAEKSAEKPAVGKTVKAGKKAAAVSSESNEKSKDNPVRKHRGRKPKAEKEPVQGDLLAVADNNNVAAAADAPDDKTDAAPKKKRGGWWSREK